MVHARYGYRGNDVDYGHKDKKKKKNHSDYSGVLVVIASFARSS